MGSIAVYERELTAEEAATLGLPKASGIPTSIESAPEVSIPTISITRQTDGTIKIEFEGKLQSSANTIGPWKDIDANSPTSITADEAHQFYRTRN